ncbi:MAG: hypothetical protein PVI09_04045 [Anaerolineae bacterium]|jgi:hypothetical protein
MQDESYYPMGLLDGSDVGVQTTPTGQDILIRQSDIGHSLSCLLGFGKADIVRLGDITYWRIVHNRRADDLLVELIDLLISIRYAHPHMVHLEMIVEPDES